MMIISASPAKNVAARSKKHSNGGPERTKSASSANREPGPKPSFSETAPADGGRKGVFPRSQRESMPLSTRRGCGNTSRTNGGRKSARSGPIESNADIHRNKRLQLHRHSRRGRLQPREMLTRTSPQNEALSAASPDGLSIMHGPSPHYSLSVED